MHAACLRVLGADRLSLHRRRFSFRVNRAATRRRRLSFRLGVDGFEHDRNDGLEWLRLAGSTRWLRGGSLAPRLRSVPAPRRVALRAASRSLGRGGRVPAPRVVCRGCDTPPVEWERSARHHDAEREVLHCAVRAERPDKHACAVHAQSDAPGRRCLHGRPVLCVAQRGGRHAAADVSIEGDRLAGGTALVVHRLGVTAHGPASRVDHRPVRDAGRARIALVAFEPQWSKRRDAAPLCICTCMSRRG
jgi:hypothetical protein